MCLKRVRRVFRARYSLIAEIVSPCDFILTRDRHPFDLPSNRIPWTRNLRYNKPRNILMNTNLLLPFIAYFSILLTIGLISHRRQTSDADFIIGNRSLNFWVTALSAHASDMSSWLFMAFPAAIYVGGLSQLWIAIAVLCGMFLSWQLVAKKLRISTEKYNTYTLSSFFEKRFNDSSGAISLLTAVMSIFFLTCYVAAGLIAIGDVLQAVFGIDFYIGISISTMVVVIYTFIGGFITVAWTDLFQALFLLLVIIIVPIVGFFSLDNGFESIFAAARQQDISLSLFPDFSIESLTSIIFLVLAWAPGYFGQPHIITKFMGINDAANMYKSKYVGMTWQLIALLSASAIGLVGMAFFKGELSNPELVFVEMVKALFHPLGTGFILCGVLAACMSTIDSQILVSSSVISEDLYKKFFHQTATPKELLRITRFGVIIISMISLALALNRSTTILEAVLYAWSGLGSVFGPVVLAALYSKQANKYGVIVGILVGGIVAGTWPSVNPYLLSITVPAMIPGFTLNALCIYLVSKWTNRRSIQVID